MLNCKDDRLALDALKYLTDRRDGKSYQAANPTLENETPTQIDPSRVADPRMPTGWQDLLPPPSAQITVSQARERNNPKLIPQRGTDGTDEH